jgi:hypothetical protein
MMGDNAFTGAAPRGLTLPPKGLQHRVDNVSLEATPEDSQCLYRSYTRGLTMPTQGLHHRADSSSTWATTEDENASTGATSED